MRKFLSFAPCLFQAEPVQIHLQIKRNGPRLRSVLSFGVFGSSALAVNGLHKVSWRFVLRCSAVEVIQTVEGLENPVTVLVHLDIEIISLCGVQFLMAEHLHQQEHIHIVKGTSLPCVTPVYFAIFVPSQVLKMLLFAYYYTAWMVGSQVGLCEKTLNFQWFFCYNL